LARFTCGSVRVVVLFSRAAGENKRPWQRVMRSSRYTNSQSCRESDYSETKGSSWRQAPVEMHARLVRDGRESCVWVAAVGSWPGCGAYRHKHCRPPRLPRRKPASSVRTTHSFAMAFRNERRVRLLIGIWRVLLARRLAGWGGVPDSRIPAVIVLLGIMNSLHLAAGPRIL